MIFRIWPLCLIGGFLIACCVFSSAQALEPGDRVPDFVMHSENGPPQRLSEQIGKPVMIIWLDDCNACSKSLIDWQNQTESSAVDGLVIWFVWRPKKDYRAPQSRFPVLSYREHNKDAWLFRPTPSVMLISPDGVLEHLFLYQLDDRKSEITSTLISWLKNKQWLQEGIL
jgi:hypothetical protein